MTKVTILTEPDGDGFQVSVDDEQAGPWYPTVDDALAYALFALTNGTRGEE